MHNSTLQQDGTHIETVRHLLLHNQPETVDVDVVRNLLSQHREEQFRTYLSAKLQGLTCPEHGSVPEIALIPEPGGFSVDLLNDCCPTFTALCAEKLQ